MGTLTRPVAPTERADAAQLLRVPLAALDHGLRVVVDQAGPAQGAAAWRADTGDIAELGGIVWRLRPPVPLTRMYDLVRGCAEEALDAGFTRAAFKVHDTALLRVLEKTFTITAVPIGYVPLTPEDEKMGLPRTPVSWRVEVDLLDALAQLDAVLGPTQ